MSKRSRPVARTTRRPSTPTKSTLERVRTLIKKGLLTEQVDAEEDARLDREIDAEIRRQTRPKRVRSGR